jgi:hypothetical protein
VRSAITASERYKRPIRSRVIDPLFVTKSARTHIRALLIPLPGINIAFLTIPALAQCYLARAGGLRLLNNWEELRLPNVINCDGSSRNERNIPSDRKIMCNAAAFSNRH